MIHPITGRLIEDGSGALPLVQQLARHIAAIEQESGPDVAAEISKALEEAEPAWKAKLDADRTAAAEEAAHVAEQAAYDARVKKALALLDETEAAEAAEAAKAQAAAPLAEEPRPVEPAPAAPASEPPAAAAPPADVTG